MADDIALNRAQRTTLFSLQQIDRDSAISQRRLSFGRKIVDVTDGATQFFQARALSNRISDIAERGEQVDQALSALQTFVGGTQNLQNLIDIARGHILRVEANLESTAQAQQTRASITDDFREVLRNFFETTNSLEYGGLNLLIDENRRFTVRFSDRNNDRLVLQGRNLFASGAYTLEKGNLFGRDVINPNGLFNFRSVQLDLDAVVGASPPTIVVRGDVRATSDPLATATNGDIVFDPGATLSVIGGTDRTINAAAATTAPTGPLTYRNVDRVAFTVDTSSVVVDNGDGSYSITGVDSLEIGATATSGVTGTATTAEVGGFSAIDATNSGVLDEIRFALDLAKDRLETLEGLFGSNVALLQERLSFGIGYSNDLTVGRDKIVLADVNQEAAILTTLRTRNQIGIGALASNAESEQQLLRLLS